ncbi:XkdX family protein [Paenibacillus sp. MDMC362]|nr:XkdX family protein [Paenibacillus sp. MDMC362]RAR41936.1 XkdX family protein [Paenibacillus sp. MDMC362]
MFENDFERLKYYYEKKWAQKPQLRQYVAFGVITSKEYEVITGEAY